MTSGLMSPKQSNAGWDASASRRRAATRARATAAVAAVGMALAVVAVPSAPAAGDGSGAVAGTPRAAAGVIAAGGDHTCVVDEVGDARCWGAGADGRLGYGNTTSVGDGAGEIAALGAIDLGTDRTATSISAGQRHTCAILDTGDVRCWGNGGGGKLGNGANSNIGDGVGDDVDVADVVELGTDRTAIAIAAGQQHTCAILDDESVKCWGANADGQLGIGSTETIGDEPDEMGDDLPAVELGTGRTATAITVGDYHTCAVLDDGTVKCWGQDEFKGQLGNGASSTEDIGDEPDEMGDDLAIVELPTGRTAKAIAAGAYYTCVLLDDDTITCWGEGGAGRLGNEATAIVGDDDGEMGINLVIVDLGNGRTAKAVDATAAHTCALLDDDTIKCWGFGGSGRLGNDATTNIGDGQAGNEAVAASDAIGLGNGRSGQAVAAGGAHTCALLDNATIKCWGEGDDGRLGNGNGAVDIGDLDGPTVAASAPLPLATDVVPPATTSAPPATVAVDVPATAGKLDVSWPAPTDNGGSAVTGYRIESSTDGATWTTRVANTGSTATSATVPGLTNATPYSFRIRALNSVGASIPSRASMALAPAAPPVATISAAPGQADPAESAPVAFAVSFDQTVVGFTTNDVVLGGTANPTAVAVSGASPNFMVEVSGMTSGGTVTARVRAGAVTNAQSQPNVASNTASVGFDPPTPIVPPTPFESLAPERFVDTRAEGQTLDDLFEAEGKRDADSQYQVQIGGRGAVPADAIGVIANVTAVAAEDGGFITAHPCVDPRPVASSLNYTTGVNLGNEIIAPLSASGELCLYTFAATHLTVDVVGFVGADSPVAPITPGRFLDTRPAPDGETVDGLFVGGDKPSGGSQVILPVAGRDTIPDDIAAVIVNVTAIGAENTGFVTVHPCLDQPPLSASLNFVAGVNRGNELIASVDDDGNICLYTSTSAHLSADIVGYLPSGTGYAPTGPARLLETRPGEITFDGQDQAIGKREADSEYTLQVTGRGLIPDDATSAVVNVTGIAAEDVGFLTVHPCLDERPNTASLNVVAGVNGGNEIITQLDDSGQVCIYTSATIQLTADIVATT